MDNYPFKIVDSYILSTGRRYGEIGAISDFYWRGDEVIFKCFPEFLAKMEKEFGEWKSHPPKISPFIQGRLPVFCSVRAFNYMKARPVKATA